MRRGSHPENLGKPAPQFVVSDGTKTVDLSKLRGKVVVLNLWASWCAPCIEELPSLLALPAADAGSGDCGGEHGPGCGCVPAVLEKNHVNLVTVRDADGRINALYGTAQIPETYVIDRQGILRRKVCECAGLDQSGDYGLSGDGCSVPLFVSALV